MNPLAKLLIQFLVTTELALAMCWMVYTLIDNPTMPTATRDVLTTVLYQIVPLITGAVGYWLGTSISSSSKDETISKLSTGGSP